MTSPSLIAARGGSHLLHDGHHIPLVGLGTYKITGEAVRPAVDAALAAGYRLFDTAKYYVNEPELGEALKELLPAHGLRREDVFLTTKFFPEPERPAERARELVDESLQRLGTDYLDLVLIHYPKPDSFDNEDARNPEFRKATYLALQQLRIEGKIRSVGVSNYESKHIEEIKGYGEGVPLPVANQVEFHPHFTRNQLREYCAKNNVFFYAFTSLGRQHPDLIGDPVIVALAEKYNTTPQLVLLAWAVGLGIGIVPKSASPARIADNFKVVDVQLTAAELDQVTALNRDKAYVRTTGWLVV